MTDGHASCALVASGVMDGLVGFPLARYFTPDDLQRGAEWMRTQNLCNAVSFLLDSAVLLAFSLGAPGRALWDACARRESSRASVLDRVLGPRWRPAGAFLGVVVFLRSAVMLPVTLFAFRTAHRIGLSQESVPSFLRRMIVQAAVLSIGSVLIGAVIGALRGRWPRSWWLVIGIVAGLVLAAETVVDPLFDHANFRVHPLPAGPLRNRLETLLASRQSPVSNIVTIDASRYGTQANAYVTGFGPTRRIVLTDTLLAYGDDAVVGAVAHEIGHRRDDRLPFRLACAGLGMVALLWFVERCLAWKERHGAGHPVLGVPLAMWGLMLILTALLPIRAARDRAEEVEADGVELSIRRDYDAYVDEQVRLARSNALDPDPPAFLRMLLNHPTVAERIGRALWYKEHASALP